MTEHTLAKLYQNVCAQNDGALDDVNVSDLIDLAEGRLAGERRACLVEQMAQSPRLAAAYRMAKASGDWSRALAQDLAGEQRQVAPVQGKVVPLRRSYRQRFAMAAAVSAMAVGAVFVGQRMQAPVAVDATTIAGIEATFVVESDAILAASFGHVKGDSDVIFSARTTDRDDDRIFSFGRGS